MLSIKQRASFKIKDANAVCTCETKAKQRRLAESQGQVWTGDPIPIGYLATKPSLPLSSSD